MGSFSYETKSRKTRSDFSENQLEVHTLKLKEEREMEKGS